MSPVDYNPQASACRTSAKHTRGVLAITRSTNSLDNISRWTTATVQVDSPPTISVATPLFWLRSTNDGRMGRGLGLMDRWSRSEDSQMPLEDPTSSPDDNGHRDRDGRRWVSGKHEHHESRVATPVSDIPCHKPYSMMFVNILMLQPARTGLAAPSLTCPTQFSTPNLHLVDLCRPLCFLLRRGTCFLLALRPYPTSPWIAATTRKRPICKTPPRWWRFLSCNKPCPQLLQRHLSTLRSLGQQYKTRNSMTSASFAANRTGGCWAEAASAYDADTTYPGEEPTPDSSKPRPSCGVYAAKLPFRIRGGVSQVATCDGAAEGNVSQRASQSHPWKTHLAQISCNMKHELS